MIQNTILKGVILAALWSSTAIAQPLILEVYNEGIEDVAVKSGYAMHLNCVVDMPRESLRDTVKVVAPWIPPKGKGALFEIADPFPLLKKKELPWEKVRLSYAIQIIDEESGFLSSPLRTDHLSSRDISQIPQDRIILSSLENYNHSFPETLDAEGDAIKKAQILRSGGGNIYYFRKPTF